MMSIPEPIAWLMLLVIFVFVLLIVLAIPLALLSGIMMCVEKARGIFLSSRPMWQRILFAIPSLAAIICISAVLVVVIYFYGTSVVGWIRG